MAEAALTQAPRPTAFFAANNFIAIGAYHAMKDAGVHVPGDDAIVAFDDLPMTTMIEPFFTVVAQPAREMGRQVTQLLLARLAGEAAGECCEAILPIEVIVRRSSGGQIANQHIGTAANRQTSEPAHGESANQRTARQTHHVLTFDV